MCVFAEARHIAARFLIFLKPLHCQISPFAIAQQECPPKCIHHETEASNCLLRRGGKDWLCCFCLRCPFLILSIYSGLRCVEALTAGTLTRGSVSCVPAGTLSSIRTKVPCAAADSVIYRRTGRKGSAPAITISPDELLFCRWHHWVMSRGFDVSNIGLYIPSRNTVVIFSHLARLKSLAKPRREYAK